MTEDQKAKTLGTATPRELCDALLDWTDEKGRHLSDEWFFNALSIDLPEEPDIFDDHSREIAEIYEAIASGECERALQLIYSWTAGHVPLLHPVSAMRLARPT